MRSKWIQLLTVALFAFWATGVARYVHEITEHQASADHEDHDDCAVCQALTAMTVDHTPAIAVPAPTAESVPAMALPTWCAPQLRAEFCHPTTGPPADA